MPFCLFQFAISLCYMWPELLPQSNGYAAQNRFELWQRASATGGTTNKQIWCGDRKTEETDCVCVR